MYFDKERYLKDHPQQHNSSQPDIMEIMYDRFSQAVVLNIEVENEDIIRFMKYRKNSLDYWNQSLKEFQPVIKDQNYLHYYTIVNPEIRKIETEIQKNIIVFLENGGKLSNKQLRDLFRI